MTTIKKNNSGSCCTSTNSTGSLSCACKKDCECGCMNGKIKKCSCSAKIIAKYIQNGAIGILETDTIYGLVGSAFFPDVVNRIYQVKLRDITKPFIVLISDVEQLKYFGVEVSKELISNIRKCWPGRYSIILPTTENEKFEHLTRGSGTICFRMPDRADLFELIDLSGPIVAPSANLEGKPPAKTINEAYGYFGDKVDFYCDSGFIDRAPSKVLMFKDGEMVELRS